MQSIALAFKQAFSIGFLSLAILNIAPLSRAVTVESVPNPQQVNRGWVTDMANLLSPATEAEINRLISELEAKNGSEIAVVTVPETAPSASPKEFATTLFNRWGIGKKGQDNGVLVLISQGDRRVEIETGYGVESILPDAKVGDIIQKQITPRFKQGDFDGGILAGTRAIVVVLRADTPTATVGSQPSTNVPSTTVNTEQPSANGGVSWLLLTGLGGGGVGLAAIAAVYARSRRPIFVEPEGRSQTHGGWWRRPLHCAICKQPMQKLNATTVLSHLSQPEKVAQKIGSLEFEGWQCPKHAAHPTASGIHIRAYVLNSYRFSTCPNCQELTVERSEKTLRHPTQFREGRRLITKHCHNCSYHQEKEERIPRLPPPPPPSSSSGGSSYSGGSSSGGGSSFGGGSSGGGGAGGSW